MASSLNHLPSSRACLKLLSAWILSLILWLIMTKSGCSTATGQMQTKKKKTKKNQQKSKHGVTRPRMFRANRLSITAHLSLLWLNQIIMSSVIKHWTWGRFNWMIAEVKVVKTKMCSAFSEFTIYLPFLSNHLNNNYCSSPIAAF